MKKWDKQQWLILLLLGAILLVMAIPVKEKSEKSTASGTAYGSSHKSPYEDPYDETGQALTERAALERQLEGLLKQVEGIGQVQVMLMSGDASDGITSFSAQEEDIKVKGVLIVAQGGDDPVVVRNIQEAVMALFQVEAHKIKVMKMK